MKLMPIFNSLLETDQYKFNMQNIAAKRFSDYTCTWTFKCRNANVRFTPEMVAEIRAQVDHYCTLRFTEEELDYLKKTLPWLSAGYINFLRFWHPLRNEILINEDNIQPYNDCGIAIEAKGTWLSTMMYEIAILAIVSEVYFAFRYGVGAKDIEFQRRTMEKFADFKENGIGVFSEFGLRRRYSTAMQDWLVKYIVESGISGFVGTSNVHLARKYGVKPVGTMAHEFIMAVGQGNHRLNPAYSNEVAMKEWTDEYGTKNGIVLGDTITTDCFLRDFGDKYANLFGGVRHDSGDPFAWGEKLITHYEKLGIDPKTKTLLFSDSLNFDKARALRKHFEGRAKVAFGIGTFLSNDTDAEPLNIVMKLTEVNGSPVAKISDVAGKGMCRDERYEEYLRRAIDWRLAHER